MGQGERPPSPSATSTRLSGRYALCMTGPWLLEFFIAPLVVGVVLLGLSALVRVVRVKVWKPLGRGLRWLTTLRVTTSTRLEAAARELTEAREEVLRENAEAARLRQKGVDLETEIEAFKVAREHRAAAEKEAARVSGHADGLAEGRAAGRSEALAKIEAERAVLRPRPAWRVDVIREGAAYVLRNSQPDAVATDVELDTHHQEFAFTGPRQWMGAFPGEVEFQGGWLEMGRRFGVTFRVQYRDELGDVQEGRARVDKEPRRAVIL